MSLSNTQITAALGSLDSAWFSDERNFYGETFRNDETGLFHIGEETYEEEDDIPTDKLEPCCYTDMRILHDGVKQLIEENKKLKEQNEDNLASLNFYTEQCAELKDERKKLKLERQRDTIAEVRSARDRAMSENKKLKEEAATNQRRATIYQFMSEYMEKADCMGDYFDYIREYYPDQRTAAGDLVSSDEEEE